VPSGSCPILLFDDLAKINMSEAFKDLLVAIENRGPMNVIRVKLGLYQCAFINYSVIVCPLALQPVNRKSKTATFTLAATLSEPWIALGNYIYHGKERVTFAFLIRSTGLDLGIQQKFRWVQLRCDQEPTRGLLSRHLHRRLINIHGGHIPNVADDPVARAVEWVLLVWQRLNEGLTKLGLLDLVFGPSHFLSCPVQMNKPKAILRLVFIL
jgi:hypothetical protein